MSCNCGCTDCGLAALARVYGLRGLTATRATLTRGGLPVRTTATTTEPVEIEVQTQPGYGVPTRIDAAPSRVPMPVRGQPISGGFIEDPPLPVPIITTPVYEIPRDSQDVAIPPRPSNDRGSEMPARTPVSAPVPASTPQTSTSADVSILPGSDVVSTIIDAISRPSFPWGLIVLTVGGYFLLTSDLLKGKGGRKR